MADVSHRDSTGSLSFTTDSLTGIGSPEGVVTADVGAVYRRRDGGTNTTFYVKETGTGNTGWVAYGAAQSADITAVEDRLDTIEGNQWVTQARIANGAVGQTQIADEAVAVSKLSHMAQGTLLGRSTTGIGDPEGVYLGSSLSLPAGGTLQRAALTGDVTASLNSNATTIANDAVTNAKLADMATQTFKGRTTAGTGDPEDLTTAQATALLDLATTSVKGLAPVLSNDTTQFLRGDGSYAVPKRKLWLYYGAATVTASTTGRYLNPPGVATTPAPTTVVSQCVPVDGNLVAIHYHCSTPHSTNTVEIRPRYNGVETDVDFDVAASDARVSMDLASPIAVVRDSSLACRIDHNGATNVLNAVVSFEIEY